MERKEIKGNVIVADDAREFTSNDLCLLTFGVSEKELFQRIRKNQNNEFDHILKQGEKST